MGFTKYILPVLSVAGAAFAASNGTCPDTDDDGAYTITSQSEADALSSCTTFDGTVVIDSSVSGNIQINGVQQITGNLSAYNATALTSISTDQLNAIGGYFRLEEITVLSTLQMSSLTSVDVINFVGLPNLQSLTFSSGVQKASGVRIVNTQLQSLDGIELDSVGAMEVTNNDYLTDFNVNNLAEVTSYLTVAANGADLSIEFPNLLTAANLTFRNVSSVSVPSLANVTGALGCYSNSFKTFSAANLTTVGNALVFNDNSKITNISIPELLSVGGAYQIANNSALKVIDGFTKLKTIGGGLDFSGDFTNVSLPALEDVKGQFNIQSTSELDCSEFKEDKENKVIKGSYYCSGSLAEAGTAGSRSSSTASSSGSGSSSTSAAIAMDMDAATMGIFGALAALFMI
ncbi:putative gpi-anchored cell wall organization protein ecm33 [Phaeomoniella chlamydospora]|uniref:Putative gpi-anchored cell wall organization protein ecm33 n=1 Tax=Phaeomoniella chlamydospora TaxID=158046 RepID=A0A0G2EBW3_PHACM|nr:putative gpi-anchored cell wall organization protein ecm33 [Phaeomoniella chlamydospora]